MTIPNKTQAQLKTLGHPRIGIELKDGTKYFGKVTKFTKYNIYFKDKNGDVLDVPRRITTRALLCIDGGKERDGKPTCVSKQNQTDGG